MELKNISINKCIDEIKAIESKYSINLSTGEARESIRNKFIREYSAQNHNVDVDRLQINADDKKKIFYADSYSELKTILDKYVKNSSDVKLSQMRVHLNTDVYYESEAKKIAEMTNNKVYTGYSFRNTQPIETIYNLLYKKTEKYVTLGVYDFRGQTVDDLNNIISIICDIKIDFRKGYDESIANYEKRINSTNPELNIKPFKNGNMRLFINNPAKYEDVRRYFIDKEMKLIEGWRK
jgi:hypothetical protein